MSNGSKSVNDGSWGVVKKNRMVKEKRENVQIESCIAFSQLDNRFLILRYLF